MEINLKVKDRKDKKAMKEVQAEKGRSLLLRTSLLRTSKITIMAVLKVRNQREREVLEIFEHFHLLPCYPIFMG